jgi:hypothetical protein
MHLRHLQPLVDNALGDTPVICLNGAARTGKTTLVEALQAAWPGTFARLSDPATLAWATGDPAGFLDSLPGLAFLDDAHRAPGLLPLLPAAVADGRRFLLTSTEILPRLARSLAWRMETFTLWPLAQAELQSAFPGLIDASFAGDPTLLRLEPLDRRMLLSRVLTGGYAEVQELAPRLREGWFHDYIGALARDLRVLTDLGDARQLIRLLAASGSDPAAQRCRELLARRQLMASLPAVSGPPFRCFNDSALQAQLLGPATAGLDIRPILAAPLLETFAFMELVKTAPWSQSRPALRHLRAGAQSLLVLEDHRRDLIAFAVNASATVQAEDFQGLLELRARVGERLRAGLVLHAGEAVRRFGPGLWTLPFQALWAARA